MEELQILEHTRTAIGTIYLGRRLERRSGPPPVGGAQTEQPWVTEIHIDGHLLMSSIDPVSERRLASSALARHRGTDGLQVLVGGLGLGYTADEALADPRVKRVQIVEAMDFVIDWMARGMFPLSASLAGDERVSIARGDVYARLLGPVEDRFDVIVVDVDHAPDDLLSPNSQPFYTEAGQRDVAKHLRPGGVLAVWAANDNDAFAAVLGAVYRNAHREHVVWDDREQPGVPFHNVLFIASGPHAGSA